MDKKIETRERANLTEEEKKKIDEILNGNFQHLNEYAKKVAKEELANKKKGALTTSQIRNVFDKLQWMKNYDPNQLALLRAQLAYAVGRAKKENKYGIQKFQEILDYAIQKVKDNESFKNLKHLAEALVAYHKYFGGKER